MTYPNASVTAIVNSVSGYPEISYWRDEYLCKKISDHNKDALCNVKFTNIEEGGIDLLFMFNITSGGDRFDNPEPSSLYNIRTLKKLIAIGDASIDIVANKDTNFEDAVAGNMEDWILISNTLGICTSVEEAKCEVKHAYMIYMWLETLFTHTFQRVEDGGNLEMGVIPTLG